MTTGPSLQFKTMTATRRNKNEDDHATTRPLLEVSALSKRFGGHVALDDLTFSVLGGETFGVAGPNGAGKSTLVNVCTGALSYEQGTILLAGNSLKGLSSHEICHRKVCRTFQIPQVFGTMSVYENVKIGLDFGNTKPTKSPDDLIAYVLKVTELEPYKRQNAGHLPLLRKKMTMLAAVLAIEPRLLFLDEPLAGLSQNEISELIELITRIKSELALTLVIIEHKVRALVQLADRLMILHYGECLDLDVPSKVVANKIVKDIYLGSATYV